MSIEKLLQQLQQEGLLSSEQYTEVKSHLQDDQQLLNASTPWYLRLLMGFCGWIAGLFFLAFLGCFGFFNESSNLIVIGSIILLLAITMRRINQYFHVDIVVQLALSWAIAGQLSIIIGVASTYQNISITCLTSIFLAVILLFLYPDPVQRFASTVSVFTALPMLLFQHKIPYAMDVTVLTQTTMVTLCWIHWQAAPKTWLPPISYGLCASLLLNLLSMIPRYTELPYASSFSSIPMILALLYVAWQALPTWKRHKDIWLCYLALLVIAICMWKAPGVAAGLLIFCLAIHRQNNILMALSITYLVLFGAYFYYNLELTLLYKSMWLIISGILAIIIRSVALHIQVKPEQIDA